MRWSLKWKIQFWHGLILTILAVILGVLFYRHEREIMVRETDWMLDQCIHPLLAHVRRTQQTGERPRERRRPPRHGSKPSRREAPEGWEAAGFQPDPAGGDDVGPLNVYRAFTTVLQSQGYYFAVWDSRGDEPVRCSQNAPDIVHPGIRGPGAWRRDIPGERREIFQRLRHESIVVGRYTADLDATLAALRTKIYIGGSLIVAVGLGVGTFFVSGCLRPIQGIRRSSRRVAEGKLSERIEFDEKKGSREITKLSTDLNATFASLETLFERQVAFTADASHELRTPLTALIAQVKRGRSGNRSEQDYQSIFEICDRSLARLKHIVDDLLELSRYDSGQVELDRDDLALDLLVTTIADDYRPMIEEQGSRIDCEVSPCHAFCDPFRIEQIISNLITNAVSHNCNPVKMLLRVKAVEGWATIEVEDNGKGIAIEHHEHLFDRFFQEKKADGQAGALAKSKKSGLGLAISKAIVEAHRGGIQVRSQPGVSTVFEVRLPSGVRA